MPSFMFFVINLGSLALLPPPRLVFAKSEDGHLLFKLVRIGQNISNILILSPHSHRQQTRHRTRVPVLEELPRIQIPHIPTHLLPIHHRHTHQRAPQLLNCPRHREINHSQSVAELFAGSHFTIELSKVPAAYYVGVLLYPFNTVLILNLKMQPLRARAIRTWFLRPHRMLPERR